VAGVEIEGAFVADAQLEGGLGFVGVGEPVEGVEFDGTDVGGQQAQGAAGFDGRELPVVPEQAHARAVGFGDGQQSVEVAGADHARLVHQDHIPWPYGETVCFFR
jgi:hypothetical protein